MEIDLVLPKKNKIGSQSTSLYFGKIKGGGPKTASNSGYKVPLRFTQIAVVRSSLRQLLVPTEHYMKYTLNMEI